MKVPRILHYPGSKWSMADWILSHMPPHTTYLEPYFGSGAVLFNKERSVLETVNDLDGEVSNLFEIIRDRPDDLARLIHWTPYARAEYYRGYETEGTDLERARRFLVRCWMARGGKTSDRTGWRHIIDLNAPHPAKDWQLLPDKIMTVTDRLRGVQVENQPAIQLIVRYKRPEVLIYADPPYILSTRNNRMYKCEMKDKDHEELLAVLLEHPGPVILSGYAHPMYDDRLKHWRRETKVVKAEAGRSRTEVLWINPSAAGQVGQMQLF
ncbi:DNA adenine methylase [Paenibacillus sp. HN-1]|uniref:DNA adenine methylase n=1 Tax=Paenibacillus TaxID=44249 RepID=UPI001CA9A386|nr:MULTISPECIES: DNA adenine methylase [Paenibacillus]MBY9081025.1 DNA adenine methylase [Paenibacillus sp. CGMCC 1.18879]MBY9087062.1 DNA adenine methylase [Paenibacillus sinensis]